jgi:hypothetical protein
MLRAVRFVIVLLGCSLVVVGALGLPAEARPLTAAGSTSTSATERYFGEGAFQAVMHAAASTSRSCSITNNGLAAMVLAPVFAESSAATTPSTAPSPMTLSRYDEWNGVLSDSQGTPENNYGLYAFRNPHTPYKRAFWHPGLGIWQYDTAGLGAPLTTVESMDVRVVAGAVASEISRRYCLASGTGAQRRHAAWSPWTGCATGNCEEFFLEMATTTPPFANLNLVAGIGPLGGVVQRTCYLEGVAGPLPCWYVKPVVGTIQGATAWATLSPLDGGSPTAVPTPISLPFYVVDRGATEERHWLRVDTGYGIDIRATRTIGRDARPRSTQAGSGLAWSSSSSLCDATANRGSCYPIPPLPKRADTHQVVDQFQPLVLDIDGSGVDDVLWYGRGTARDALWLGSASGTFTGGTMNVKGTYTPIVGDFDGDHRDDVFWYAPGSALDTIWWGATPYTSRVATTLNVRGTYKPLVGDFDGNGSDDIFWYAPGSAADSIWYGRPARSFHGVARPVRGTYTPLVTDLNATGRDDVVWYRSGAGTHAVWYGGSSPGSFTPRSVSVAGSHSPFVGDFDGDSRGDVFFYAPGSAADTVLYGGSGTSTTKVATSVRGSYWPVAADLLGDGRTDVIWYSLSGGDSVWMGNANRTFSSRGAVVPYVYLAMVGQMDDGPGQDVLWYWPGSAHPDAVWLDP